MYVTFELILLTILVERCVVILMPTTAEGKCVGAPLKYAEVSLTSASCRVVDEICLAIDGNHPFPRVQSTCKIFHGSSRFAIYFTSRQGQTFIAHVTAVGHTVDGNTKRRIYFDGVVIWEVTRFVDVALRPDGLRSRSY